MSRTPLLLIILVLCLSFSVFAGTSGKITGKVIDIDTNQPLPGVNVIIEGTNLGAATNLQGYYVILNVSPGTFDLKFSMMGYTEYLVQDVRVVIDLTTTVNAQLKSEILSGEEVVVVAERPLVIRDISNSQMNIESQQIESIPIPTVKDVFSLQAGIEKDRQGIVVRGGKANQTIFMVDGLSLNDERSNIPYAAVNLSSLQEIQIQTGGFNAEYGNVRSGLINVVTKEGSMERYSAIAAIRYQPAAPKHFGISAYDPYSYFNRPYMDPAVCWTGTSNGEPYDDLNTNGVWDNGEPFFDYNRDGTRSVWDVYTQKQYPYFEGWNAVSELSLQNSDPNDDLTPQGAKRLYEYQHRRQGDIEKPDYVLDFGLGGPIPFIGKDIGNLRFHLSHFREQNMFVFPLSRDNYGENHTQLKLTADLSSSIKMTLTGLYGEIHSVSPYNWQTTPTGRVINTQEEVAGLLNSSSGNSILYMPGYYSPSTIYRNMFGIKFTHVTSPQTFQEVSFQYNTNRYNTFEMARRDTTKKYEIIPNYFVDEAPYGYWGNGVTGIDQMIMGGWMNLGRDKSVNSTFSLRYDITSQVNLRNQIKSGLQIVYNDFNIKSSTESPSMTTWTRSMIYHIFPYRISAYVQDKLEFQGFIANVGLRFDYYDPNSDRYVLTIYDNYYRSGKGDLIESNAPREDAKENYSFSPRLGISHPITENSKLYFNYGHFRSEPESASRFRIQRESSGLVTYIGDPDLKPEKTVAYELGFEQNVYDLFLLKIAAYYKDITNQTDWIQYKGIRDVNYYKAANNNYEDIRGLEITLTKHIGKWVTGFINYTYDVRTSGYFGLKKYFEDPMEYRNELKKNLYQEKPLPQPFARANIDFHTPEKFGPQWLNFYPLSDWYLNILAEWKAGRYETYNPNNVPGVVNDVRWKDWYNVDLRVSKIFKVNIYEIQFYVDVTNIFNIKYMTAGLLGYRNYAGFADQYDYNDYLESLNFSWEDGVEHGHDKLGDYRPPGVAYDPLEPNLNNDPDINARNDHRKKTKSYIDMPNIQSLAFLNPRSLSFGIRVNF